MKLSQSIQSVSTLLFAVGLTAVLGMTSVLAQPAVDTGAPLKRLNESVGAVGGIVGTSTIVVVSLAFLFFFYNLAMFVLKSDEDTKAKAKANMLWGVLAMVVITSLWGLITFVRSIFGVGAGSDANINEIKVPGVTFNQQGDTT